MQKQYANVRHNDTEMAELMNLEWLEANRVSLLTGCPDAYTLKYQSFVSKNAFIHFQDFSRWRNSLLKIPSPNPSVSKSV